MSRSKHTEAQIICFAEAGGSGAHSGRCGPGVWGQPGNDLHVEGEVRWSGPERGAPTALAGG